MSELAVPAERVPLAVRETFAAAAEAVAGLVHLLGVVIQDQVRFFLGQNAGGHIAAQFLFQAVQTCLLTGFGLCFGIGSQRVVQGFFILLGVSGRGFSLGRGCFRFGWGCFFRCGRSRFCYGSFGFFGEGRSAQAQGQQKGQGHQRQFFHGLHVKINSLQFSGSRWEQLHDSVDS